MRSSSFTRCSTPASICCQLSRRDDQREQVERPGPLRAVGIGIDVVGDAVVAHLPFQVHGAAVQVGESVAAEVLEEPRPREPASGDSPCGLPAAQLVEMAGARRRRQRGRERCRRFLGVGFEKRIGRVVVLVHVSKYCHI